MLANPSRLARWLSPALAISADSVQQQRHDWSKRLRGEGVIAAASLSEFCESVRIDRDQLRRLALSHIKRREQGRTIGEDRAAANGIA